MKLIKKVLVPCLVSILATVACNNSVQATLRVEACADNNYSSELLSKGEEDFDNLLENILKYLDGFNYKDSQAYYYFPDLQKLQDDEREQLWTGFQRYQNTRKKPWELKDLRELIVMVSKNNNLSVPDVVLYDKECAYKFIEISLADFAYMLFLD